MHIYIFRKFLFSRTLIEKRAPFFKAFCLRPAAAAFWLSFFLLLLLFLVEGHKRRCLCPMLRLVPLGQPTDSLYVMMFYLNGVCISIYMCFVVWHQLIVFTFSRSQSNLCSSRFFFRKHGCFAFPVRVSADSVQQEPSVVTCTVLARVTAPPRSIIYDSAMRQSGCFFLYGLIYFLTWASEEHVAFVLW